MLIMNQYAGFGARYRQDPYFSYVTFLSYFEGTNGSTTFTDERGNAITVFGNTAISTAQSRFGASSLLNPSGSHGLKTGAFSGVDFGSGDFTYECFIRQTATSIAARIIEIGNGSDQPELSVFLNGGTSTLNTFIYYDGAYQLNLSSATMPSLDYWHHIAVCRSGNTIYLACDGNIVSTGSFSGTIPSGSMLRIANGRLENSTYSFVGYIDNVRVTKGIARYTTSYTVPTTTFPNA